MNIFANLPFEFLRKIVLFSFWYDINFIYIYIYRGFSITPITSIIEQNNFTNESLHVIGQ